MTYDKAPYEPSKMKRFEISEDEHSRERLRAVLEIYRELKEVFPSIGFSLYGSLTKGKVLDETTKDISDIDLAVYVDRDELLRTTSGLDLSVHNISYLPIGLEHATDVHQRAELLKTKIQLELTKKLYIESWIGMAKMTDVRVYPITRTAVGFDELYDRFIIAESGSPGGSRALSKIFRLDVGGGMKGWRRFVFDQLQRYDFAERERIWDEIDLSIREHERKGNIPSPIEKQFPQTFEEAKKYYSL